MALHAPYNFVPLSEQVFFPDWAAGVTHDIPLAEGVCGWLDITITAHTPIMIGDENQEQGTEHRFFRLPDGPYAIPGASVRGLLRNVLQIATFGKCSQVDDTRLSVRDLDDDAKHFYRDYFVTSTQPIQSKVKAGWLRFKDGHWRLDPCEYARIEHDDLNAWLRLKIDRKKAQSAEDKYQALHSTRNGLQLRYVAEMHDHQKQTKNGSTFTLRYPKVKRLDPADLDPASQDGSLVFTRQPESSKKHMEFVFAAPSQKSIVIDDQVMREFLAIYGATDAWQWLHSPNNPHGQRGIPVFWLGGGAPTSLGLSQLYRLPYEFSIWDMIRHTSDDHFSDQLDFAEGLFGTISENGQNARKGRVFCGDAVLEGEPRWDALFEGVLNSPKPSYYPAYVRQTPDRQHPQKAVVRREGDKPIFATYAKPAGGHKKPTINGWKRYRARDQLIEPRVGEGQENVLVRFTPLATGSKFRGRLQFHNLKPEEIGALVWALTWGGKKTLRHLIGMGKPFGYGQVSMEITACELRPNRCDQPTKSDPAQLNEFVKSFTATMDAWHQAALGGAWAASPPIKALTEMARPAAAAHADSDGNHGYPVLDPKGSNEFQDAKKDGWYLQPVSS
ncbi:TIGR03986 family type III CRISPR-associated RAMP protein [Thiorhodovibrio frisius]|uniref:CRISPR-associated protein n=1 Tax=Thiorhodovibrio frisius TaxID=631362 RepID=H8YVU2_9GAMM|nr:TIGR03986 family CRISPR-associated RAMP protein [Thiorhodovibrio frisius]EIC24032.1 CRISPR-associated protein [Thiorhodovibrio frisius]WPL23106.1 CRISPR-associated protein [Thiorhodovibrio frisius]